MIFEQFYLESLGHASYLVGDEKTGRALLLDPRRDVEVYLDRSPEAFAGGHIPGALTVGFGPSFSTWAGTVLPEGARVLLVLDGPALSVAGGMSAWTTSGYPIVA